MATLAEVNKTLYGNGQKGLVSRVDLVEARQGEMLWWMRLVGSTIILYVLGVWLGFLQAPGLNSSSNAPDPHTVVQTAAPVAASTPEPSPVETPGNATQIAEDLLNAARTLIPALRIIPNN